MRAACLVMAVLLAGTSIEAAAQRPQRADEETASDDADALRPATRRPPRRAIPDYGRPPVRRSPEEDLLWFPRVVFYPLHLLLHYGFRLPVGWLLHEIDQSDLGAAATNPEATDPNTWDWAFSPHVRYDEGFVPSGGLSFALNERGGSLRLRVGADTWGIDRLGGWLVFESRGGELEGGLRVQGDWRVDRIFHGFGWDSAASDRLRYARGHVTSEVGMRHRIYRESGLEVRARLSVQRFEPSAFESGDLESSAARLQVLPGSAGFTVAGVIARARFDTRERENERFATGIGVTVGGGWSMDAQNGAAATWARFDSDLELACELATDRTLALRGKLELLEPLGTEPIPFTEQVVLGGALDRLPGFLEGRLTGHSATSVGVVFRYAVWAWLDASVFADVGNVFGRSFEGFDVAHLRLSVGFVLSGTERDDFTLLVAMGTEPFARGADITSGRLAIGFGTFP